MRISTAQTVTLILNEREAHAIAQLLGSLCDEDMEKATIIEYGITKEEAQENSKVCNNLYLKLANILVTGGNL